jgi:hypothetical protein
VLALAIASLAAFVFAAGWANFDMRPRMNEYRRWGRFDLCCLSGKLSPWFARLYFGLNEHTQKAGRTGDGDHSLCLH